MLKKLLELVDGKNVFLGTHWDADGIASGAIIYHLIKKKAKSVKTISKGDVFLIMGDDVPEKTDIVICTDIHASPDVKQPVIYIDHHPVGDDEFAPAVDDSKVNYLMNIHDDSAQSCTLVIWEHLVKETDNPYYVFLTLMGYFGDGGNHEDLPVELELKGLEMFPELMQQKKSYYNNGTYLEIQKYVSALNTGKRMHWSGQVPFELLKSIESYQPFIYYQHPLAKELERYKYDLREYYSMAVNKIDAGVLEYAIIVCDKNIQGVLCQKHMNGKPVLIMNLYKGKIMGSMRVPDESDFDAGAYLEKFNGKIPTFIGGGHEKAGGVTVDKEHLDAFIDMMQKIKCI
jgi:single-stranded DNA-specific DHH superfamily exonuclease